MRPKSLVTPSAGLSCIHSVPDSWCVVPRRSRRSKWGWSAARSAAVAPAGTRMVRPPEAMMMSNSPPLAKMSATSSVKASIAFHRSRSCCVCVLPPAGRRESPMSTNARGRGVFLIISALRGVNEAVGIVRCHLPDASEGHDDRLIGGIAHGVELLQTGHLFEQLGFGVVSESTEPRCGDLQVEVPIDAADGCLALDEQGRH